MVDPRTYELWRELARHHDLPTAALPAVIEALTTPVPHHLNIGGNAERWRADAIKQALPALLNRTDDSDLRARLIAAGTREQIVQLVEHGTLTSDDAAAITAAHHVWPGLVAGLARHTHQVPAAVDLVTHLTGADLVSVISAWEMNNYRLHLRDPAPTVPTALLTAILELTLQPIVDSLARPEDNPDWVTNAELINDWSTSFGGPAWHILERVPDQWSQLVQHPDYGRAVQHILLDQADTDALSDDLLSACLPSLACPELAHLPQPATTQRQRLHHIARRAERHPRVAQMAADRLHAAADDCVKRGHLLQLNQMKKRNDHQVASLARDLAVTCGTPQHLAKVCGFLSQGRPQPVVITRPPATSILARLEEEKRTQPGFLLSWNGDHRVKTLTQLASNPHTPHDALIDALTHLHPVEVAWLQQHADLPEWFRHVLTTHAASTHDDGVVRIVTDEELDTHPDPENVLQSWLDATRPPRSDTKGDIERAILSSRHCTETLLRQLSARTVLLYGRPERAAPLLTNLCGDQPHLWTALLTALEHVDDALTFGEFLDSLSLDKTLTTA